MYLSDPWRIIRILLKQVRRNFKPNDTATNKATGVLYDLTGKAQNRIERYGIKIIHVFPARHLPVGSVWLASVFLVHL